jgi:HEAT repeat protein
LAFTWFGSELRSEPIPQDRLAEGRPNEGASRVDVLMRNLEHPRASVRKEAIDGLAAIGPAAARAIPKLVDCLEDPDLLVRAHAARAAWRVGIDPEELVPALAEMVNPEEQTAFSVAALVLSDMGAAARDALPALRACLKADSAVVRLHAAESILKIEPDNSAALHELLGAVQDKDGEARYLAVNALGSAAIENEHAVYALEMALTDTDPFVAAAAGINLSRLNDPPRTSDEPDPEEEGGPSSGELAQMIADLSHSSAVIRRMSAIRLGMAGLSARDAADALRQRLEDEDPAVAVQAANALWAIKREPGYIVPLLAELLEAEEPSIGIAAAYVLGRIRSESGGVLPQLRERLASSEQLEHLLHAIVICRIDPSDQVALGILLADLRDHEGDLRYLAALALADAPLASHRWVEKELAAALNDRNMRVQSAAGESLWVLRARVSEERTAGAARQRAGAAAPPADPEPADLPPELSEEQEILRQEQAAKRATRETARLAAEARRARQGAAAAIAAPQIDEEELARADEAEPVSDSVPAIADAAFAQPSPPVPVRTDLDEGDEGLKPIGSLRASIRAPGDNFPGDVGAARFKQEPVYFHGYGTRRGWGQLSFCWDAPAVFFKPLYFEDINLERYGIHRGCCQPILSFGHFFTRCVCLPYKLLISQPPCERIYTLGYERPNNCIPLYCYCRLGCPSFSKCCNSCCSHCDCPPCPFKRSEDDVPLDNWCCPRVSRFCPSCPSRCCDWSSFCPDSDF